MTDQQQDDNKLIAVRREKLATIRENGVAFPNQFRRDALAAELQDRLGDKTKEELEGLCQRASVAGRVMARRGPFIVIQDMSGRIQFYFDKKNLPEELAAEIKGWDIGDIVGGEGPVHKSGKGDLYVYLDKAALLTKALRPLPFGKEDAEGVQHGGLADAETRYRQRYADLAVHEDVRQFFVQRARIVSYIRRFMDDHGFIEVETPVLQPVYGGALARPFTTYHNALDTTLYLRIADELYLKRCIVGGLERVYEIGHDFRNEGIDRFHNPEFTMLEFYQAYADYSDMMDFLEAMIVGLVQEEYGGLVLENLYQAEEFLEAKSYVNVVRWAEQIHERPAAQRGMRVNKAWGPEELRVPERHSAADLD